MTLDEITYRIRNHVSGGQATNNSDKSIAQIEYDVHQLRSTMVRREWKHVDPNDFYQDITVNFSKVSELVETPSIFIRAMRSDAPTTIYKSDTQIPQLCSIFQTIPLRLTTSDFQSINAVNPHRFAVHGYNKYASLKPVVTLYRGYVYILYVNKTSEYNLHAVDSGNPTESIQEQSLPDSATVHGIFDNPSKVDQFDSSVTDYPAPYHMQMRIVESLIKRYYSQDRMPEDQTLNLEDDGMVSQ